MKALEDIAKRMGGGEVSVGFLANATYPDGTPVAAVAFWNEFGTSREVAEGEVTLNRSINESTGEFNRKGRFVKKSKANFSTTHKRKAHTITVPPRPFFRTMIAKESPNWAKTLGKLAVTYNYDGSKTLAAMGEDIKGALQQSINEFSTPELAASTVRNKGSAKPLIHTSHMVNSVDYEVKTS